MIIISNLDINLLDAGKNKRLSQKKIYGGEIFPASACANYYDTFLESFQKDKNMNNRGIVANWKHPLLPEEPLTIPGKDGDDTPLYLEKNIQRVLKKLEELENKEGEE